MRAECRQARCVFCSALPINRVEESILCMFGFAAGGRGTSFLFSVRPSVRFVCTSVSQSVSPSSSSLPLRGPSNPKPLQLGEFLECTLSRYVQQSQRQLGW